MGFIYKMLDTRDPSKRRVKPADPDLLVIRKVEHEDSDDDYTPEEDDPELADGKKKESKLRSSTQTTKTTKKATKRKSAATSRSPIRNTRSAKKKSGDT